MDSLMSMYYMPYSDARVTQGNNLLQLCLHSVVTETILNSPCVGRNGICHTCMLLYIPT